MSTLGYVEAQLVRPLEPKAGDHVPSRHGKRSAQACGMDARKAEMPAFASRLGLRQPVPEGHGLMPVVGTEAKTILRGFFDGNHKR